MAACGENQWGICKGRQAYARVFKNCTQRDKPEQHCFPPSNTCLLFRFLSSRTWRIQQQMFCLALVHPRAFKIQGIKQLVRTPGSNYFTMDIHYRGMLETTRLHSIDDRQYDDRRLAPKIQLLQTGRKQTPIVGSNQGCSKNKPNFSCCWDSNHMVNGSKENVMKLQTLSQGTTTEVMKT